VTAPTFDGSFPHRWQAEILASRPLILPSRHFIYPTQAEEVERGALEVLIRPDEQIAPDVEEFDSGSRMHQGTASQTAEKLHSGSPLYQGTTSVVPKMRQNVRWALAPEESSSGSSRAEVFLATCALGFRDPAVPTGLWATPNPDEICAVSGGYAYIIDTTAPERFTMIPYRPVLEIRPVPEQGLLLFVGHHSILAWGASGQAWQSERLTSEGLTIASIKGHLLHGQGWDMMTDKEIPFALDLRTGIRVQRIDAGRQVSRNELNER
jgi:hypothetical protein